LAQHLALQHEVHVVCGQPNSPAAGAEYRSSGTQVHGGVTIHRLRHTRFAKRVPAGRLINLLSFTRAASRYLKRSRLAADVVVSETDPFLLPAVAATHAQRIDARLVCYLQDIYPDVAEAIGKAKPGRMTRTIRKQLRTAYQAADQVIVLGSCMKERLTRPPWSIDPKGLTIVPNWADCEAIVPLSTNENAFRQQHGLDDHFVVMHSGNMGLTQRLDVLIEATQHPIWPANALLLLVGDGATRAKLESQANLLKDPQRVRFLPYQPREQLSESLSAADLHVVSMHEAITGCICPSKLYGIMAAGRPTLAIAAADTDLCRTIQEHAVGWCVQPVRPAAIASAVAAANHDPVRCQELGKRARQLSLQLYNRPNILETLAQVICH